METFNLLPQDFFFFSFPDYFKSELMETLGFRSEPAPVKTFPITSNRN